MPNRLSQPTQYRGKLQAVILDWAGTAVDYGSLAPVRTLERVFARADVALTDSEIRRAMGLPKKDPIREILSIPRVRNEWARVHRNLPCETDVERLYDDFVPLQFSCLLEYSAIIPGVVEALERFRIRGLKIGTTTGYTRDMLDLLVEASKKAGYVPDCSLAPGDVGAGRSEEHTSELQSRLHLVCRLLLEKKKNILICRLLTNIIHTNKWRL